MAFERFVIGFTEGREEAGRKQEGSRNKQN